MTTFLCEMDKSELNDIIQELERQPLCMNKTRKTSGEGRTQAFGNIKRKGFRPFLARNCWDRPELWGFIQAFAKKHVQVPWKGVQINMNYCSQPHFDKGNIGESYIIGFGDYEGGELVTKHNNEETFTDLRYRAHTFNGAQNMHWNLPHKGTKYSMIFFDWVMPKWWPSGLLPKSEIFSKEGITWIKLTDIDGSEYELRKKQRIEIKKAEVLERRVGFVGSKLKAFHY